MTQFVALRYLLGGVLAGALGTAVVMNMFTGKDHEAYEHQPSKLQQRPLYWVAPMDPNYRSDRPGKSPMGMDLVPVYEHSSAGAGNGRGTVTISPEVINNLGVRTAKVKRQPLLSTIRTVGYVRYDEDRLIHLHPRVAGWIEKLHIKAAGDPVKKGQPVYELYSPELVNAQEELLLALKRNNQRLIRAARNRLQALQLTESFITALTASKQVTQTITFYAPQDGVVDNLNIREGFFVKPGNTLMSIGALDEVWVEAEVFERQASYVDVGLPVVMTLDYRPGEQWHGSVDYVYPSLDANTRTVRVRLRFANNDGELKPNMFAQVVIETGSKHRQLVIPKEAVIRTGDQNRVVLALGDGRYKSIAVKLGRADEHYAQILEGLSSNDEVVISAQFLLDSESSKTSDFKRMHHGEDKPQQTAWVGATINKVMAANRMLNVSHQAIERWQWPAMDMDLTVVDSVDLSPLQVGMRVHIEIKQWPDKQYSIVNVHIPDREQSNSADQHHNH